MDLSEFEKAYANLISNHPDGATYLWLGVGVLVNPSIVKQLRLYSSSSPAVYIVDSQRGFYRCGRVDGNRPFELDWLAVQPLTYLFQHIKDFPDVSLHLRLFGDVSRISIRTDTPLTPALTMPTLRLLDGRSFRLDIMAPDGNSATAIAWVQRQLSQPGTFYDISTRD